MRAGVDERERTEMDDADRNDRANAELQMRLMKR